MFQTAYVYKKEQNLIRDEHDSGIITKVLIGRNFVVDNEGEYSIVSDCIKEDL